MDQSTNRITRSYYTKAAWAKGLISTAIWFVVAVVASALLSVVPILNIILWLFAGFQGILLVVDIILALVMHFNHKDIFFEEKGVYIGSDQANGEFVAWSQIDSIIYNGKPGQKTGGVVVVTNIPMENKPGKNKRYAVLAISSPEDVANEARQRLADYRAKASVTQQA